jgi:hypothetical protein
MKKDNNKKKFDKKYLTSRMFIVTYLTMLIEAILSLIHIFGIIDIQIYSNTSFLIVEVAVGISIAIIVQERTKKSEEIVGKALDDIQTNARKINSAVTKIEGILKINEERGKKKRYFVYAQCKSELEFIVSRMPRIDQCRINLLEKASHEDKLYISTDIKNMNQGIHNLKSILSLNNDIMDPDIYERIERNVEHLECYQNEKYNVSIFTKNKENKNKLIESIEYVLNLMNIQLDEN